MKREIALSVVILTDDPAPGAPERIEMEVRRSLSLWLGPDAVYVEQTEKAIARVAHPSRGLVG